MNDVRDDSLPATKMTIVVLPSGATEVELAGFVDGPFTFEQNLEQWLVSNFGALRLNAALIGAQIKFQKEKKADLLAILRDGSLCIVENKRDCAPREALAQLLDYAMELGELVAAELDQICIEKTKRPLREFYEASFGRSLPKKRPRSPLLVLVADKFEDEEESMALFLNQDHRFRIQLIRYTAEGSLPDPDVKFVTVVGPKDTLRPRGNLPEPVLMVRVEETSRHPWEALREHGFITVADEKAGLIRETLSEKGPFTVMVYLAKVGFVATGKLTAGIADPLGSAIVNTKFFGVDWEWALPRESAYFRSGKSQPTEAVQKLADVGIWRAVQGRLKFRALKSRRTNPRRTACPLTKDVCKEAGKA
jgi:hypothetical protein